MHPSFQYLHTYHITDVFNFSNSINDECDDSGFGLKPKALHTWLTRIMYNRRSKFDPLWNTFLVAGLEDGEPYLGCVDKIGTTFRDNKIATGYGAHIALPLMREAIEKKPQMTKEEVRTLLMNCLRVLYFRDTRALNKVCLIFSNKFHITFYNFFIISASNCYGHC